MVDATKPFISLHHLPVHTQLTELQQKYNDVCAENKMLHLRVGALTSTTARANVEILNAVQALLKKVQEQIQLVVSYTMYPMGGENQVHKDT